MVEIDFREFSRWIIAARKTLDSARGDAGRGDFNWACFKAQQAGGMDVKAILYGLGLPAFGHSISRLASSLRREGVEVGEDVISCSLTLDKYYIPTRYPNAWPEGSPHEYYTMEDAITAISCAEKIISWVEGTWKSLGGGESIGRG